MKKSKIEILLEKISKEDMKFIPSSMEIRFMHELTKVLKRDEESFIKYLAQYQEIYRSKYSNNKGRE